MCQIIDEKKAGDALELGVPQWVTETGLPALHPLPVGFAEEIANLMTGCDFRLPRHCLALARAYGMSSADFAEIFIPVASVFSVHPHELNVDVIDAAILRAGGERLSAESLSYWEHCSLGEWANEVFISFRSGLEQRRGAGWVFFRQICNHAAILIEAARETAERKTDQPQRH